MTFDDAQWQAAVKAYWERHAPFDLSLLKAFPVIPPPKPDPMAIYCMISGEHPMSTAYRCPRHGVVHRGKP